MAIKRRKNRDGTTTYEVLPQKTAVQKQTSEVFARYKNEINKKLGWMPSSIADVIKKAGFEYPHHLKHYVKVLETCLDEEQRVCLHSPPQHGKTTTTLCALAYHALTQKGKLFLYVTYNTDRASFVLRNDFVPILNKCNVPWTTSDGVVHINGGYGAGGSSIMFTSPQGSITGVSVTGFVIIDDPFKSDADASSKRSRDKAYNFVNGSVLTRENNNKMSVVIMATRWHADDLTGRFIMSPHNWRYIRLPAICDTGDDPNERQIGEPLWPERQPLESLKKRMEVPRVWNCMYQGTPMPQGGFPFKEPQCYLESPREKENKGYMVTYGLDAAYSGKSDWSVIVRLITDTSTWISYVDRVIRRKCRFKDFISDIASIYAEMPGKLIWVVGGQESTVGEMTEDFLKKFIPDIRIEMHNANGLGNKLVRSLPIQDAWNSGKILVPFERSQIQMMEEFIAAHVTWTGNPKEHDDDIDALANAYMPVANQIYRQQSDYHGLGSFAAGRKLIEKMKNRFFV